jgi:hypothetical protein
MADQAETLGCGANLNVIAYRAIKQRIDQHTPSQIIGEIIRIPLMIYGITLGGGTANPVVDKRTVQNFDPWIYPAVDRAATAMTGLRACFSMYVVSLSETEIPRR